VFLGSIKAGNNSIKLQDQVISLLNSLVEKDQINGKEKAKIIGDYIGRQ